MPLKNRITDSPKRSNAGPPGPTPFPPDSVLSKNLAALPVRPESKRQNQPPWRGLCAVKYIIPKIIRILLIRIFLILLSRLV